MSEIFLSILHLIGSAFNFYRKLLIVENLENELNNSANMSELCKHPYIPLLISKIGVYRRIHYFSYFCSKP